MGKFLSLLIITLNSLQLFPQKNNLTYERASQFIDALINSSDSLESFVFPEELAISKRLGIQYEGVNNKFLISYEIPAEIVADIKNKQINYNIDIQNLDDVYSILNFKVSAKNFKTKYYFKNEFLISPPYFYYNNWQKIESEHFIFYVSDTEYFNQYSIEILESFISEIFVAMNYTEEEILLLKKEKIIYLLCKDEDEIEKLTSYKARGMCNLAYDYLITTYNCHYHELVHLLMNCKMKKLPLYTHPFLQEGLAVALGGRGGKEPEVILNLGHFILSSGFINYTELFNASNFKNYDASMSYPVSGLYIKFLLSLYSFENFVELYRKYSSANVSQTMISPNDLPAFSKWENFLNEYLSNSISVDFNEENYRLLTENDFYYLKGKDDKYLVSSKGSFLISTPDSPENYKSNIFQEYYPELEYKGEKYLLRINDNEIAVYNLFTNNLIANYVSGFTLDMKPVPNENNFYKFSIPKNIFDENWNKWQFINLE